MCRLATAVVVHTPEGDVWLPAGASPSGDLAALITSPTAWVDGVMPSAPRGAHAAPPPVDEPPRTGKGSGVGAWRAYARMLGVPVDDSMSRDDIITAIDNHQQ